jgi:uncharacterized protein YgbK (DUF1537 family)
MPAGFGHHAVTERWLILADDLTGAADCAVAFARRGLPASVGWGAAGGQAGAVQAIDADSRRLPPAAAAARHRALLDAHHRPGTGLLKKLDSILRGQPAAELAAIIGFLKQRGAGAMAILAPAFPATGRTTEGGRIHLGGVPLEETPLWARDHSYPNADLRDILQAEGLRTCLLPLALVRAGPDAVAARLRAALAEDVEVAICDAATAMDLEIIATAGSTLAASVFWVGSGGLAAALAASGAAHGAGELPPRLPRRPGGMLVVVGSVAEASRAAAAGLLAERAVRAFSLPAAWLRAGPAHAGGQEVAAAIEAALRSGQDVLVDIATEGAADLSRGAELAEGLAALLAPAATQAAALFATGGETACALLTRMEVHGIRLVEELEPGVPLGITLGAHAIPVVTKAGGFGDAGTMARSLARLRAMLTDEDKA